LYCASRLEDDDDDDDNYDSGDRVGIKGVIPTLSKVGRCPMHIGIPPIFSSRPCGEQPVSQSQPSRP